MGNVITTLFAANAVIVMVMAVAFWFAGRRMPDRPFWKSWAIANVLIGAALVVFIVEPVLSGPVVDILPNGLLLLGFGLRWRAAREFSSRPSPGSIVWGPTLFFLIACFVPIIADSYRAIYIIVNVILGAFALTTAWEFWRDRADKLPSRYGLVFAYGIMGLSFAARVAQGVFDGAGIGTHLPLDMMLVIHLSVALLHTPSSGAFALSLAYERGAARLRHEANHDALTGLLNRRAFETLLRTQIERANNSAFAILLFDIDNFKAINDRYGHGVGDQAIRICAEILNDELGAAANAARVGGEEFAVILADATTTDAIAIAERVRRAVRARIVNIGERHLTMTISAGVCHSGDCGGDFDEMMRIADTALYAAKNGGRDRVENHSADIVAA